MKTEFDDERLGAFVDGELNEAESAAVKEAMLRDPALRRRVEALRRSTRQLREAFDPVLDEPVPAKILRAFPAADAARSPRRAAVSLAVAASLALVVGGLGGFLVGQSLETAPQSRAWMATLDIDASGLLNSTPSGAPVAWHSRGATLELQPVLSFRDRSGRICRQYALSDSDRGEHVDGVACRAAGGDWQVLAARPREAAGPGGTSGTGFAVASGPGAGGVDGLVDALADTVIPPAEERALIEAGWH